MMNWAAAITASTLATVSLGWLAVLWRFWAMRRNFEIKARSPKLVVVSMFHCLLVVVSVLLHWLLLSVANGLPCFITFSVTYTTLAFSVTPYILRAVRLVVAYSRELRARYARFVKTKPVMIAWAAITALVSIRAGLFFGEKPGHFSRNSRDCFFLDDTALVGVFIILFGAPTLVLAMKLSSVNDAFKIKEEIAGVVGGCVVPSVVIWSLQVLVFINALRDTPLVHIVVEVLVFLGAMFVGMCGLFIPMARAHRGGIRGCFRTPVIPVDNIADAEAIVRVEGVLALARAGGEIFKRFEAFCRVNLCMESWDFVVDVLRYEVGSDDPDEQFNLFAQIVDKYLLSTSPDEINISSATRQRISCLRPRAAFEDLGDETKANVFKEPLAEIIRMLEQNLWHKFVRVVAFENRELMSRAAGGDQEMMELMTLSFYQSGPGRSRRDGSGVSLQQYVKDDTRVVSTPG